jgi:hypothetical protein
LPEIHSFIEDRSSEFFTVLSNVKSLDIFSNEVIKAIIDFKWPLVKEYTVKFLFIPFMIYLATFIAFSNVFNGQYKGTTKEEIENAKKGKFALIIILYIFSG